MNEKRLRHFQWMAVIFGLIGTGLLSFVAFRIHYLAGFVLLAVMFFSLALAANSCANDEKADKEKETE